MDIHDLRIAASKPRCCCAAVTDHVCRAVDEAYADDVAEMADGMAFG